MVDSLLRSGADEILLNTEGKSAADLIGRWVKIQDRVADEIERVLYLLANAPADRAWRRRGYLVLCCTTLTDCTRSMTSAVRMPEWRGELAAELG